MTDRIWESTEISKDLMFLFNRGENYQSYNILGAHPAIISEGRGYCFAVWAPNARSVSVVCDKNHWDRNKNPMLKNHNSGIWSCFVPDVGVGEIYKFSVEGANGEIFMKADPFGFCSQLRPQNASVIADMSYKWNDKLWMSKRSKTEPYNNPLNIYEVHLGSWLRDEGEMLNYLQLADKLIPYVKKMGYTHIEIMPVCEYPFDGSWGYQVTGYYSANSRFGTPKDLKEFVDRFHQSGIGVIMDWVPAHFPRDAHGLRLFDGTPLFEHPDPRLGEHKEWGTLVFNWEKAEIYSFLISNAIFWLEEYHMDGLRVDAVSSMLYLDYNRRDGEWVANKYGGKENLAAVSFLQKLNTVVFERFPNVFMIAEESTAWNGVTKAVHQGGLGFNFKWNMGWMNDVLRFVSMDPYFRGANHNMVTFSMMYAYSENYILPLSHDEVVHGKKSLLDKMYGNYEQKFAGLKLLYAYMWAHPGKKLLFMGGDFGQFDEWRFDRGLDWELMEYESHRGINEFVKDLNKYYRENRSMYENDYDWRGFSWLDVEDSRRSVLSFVRQSKSGRDKTVVIANFAAQEYKDYEVNVPTGGEYTVVLSTDDAKYGGNGRKCGVLKARKKNGEYYISLDLAELSAVYVKKVKK